MNPGKQDSFWKTCGEFEYVEESTEPLISDDGVQGVGKEELLLFKDSELRRLGLTLNENKRD